MKPRALAERSFLLDRATLGTAAAALAVALPTLTIGLYLDDWVQVWRLRHSSGIPVLFDFTPLSGHGPWWTGDEFHMSLWRPLSAMLSVADISVFGVDARAWHLHSVLWSVGLALVVGGLLRRCLPGPVGVIAALAFTIDEAGALAAGWIANRNALVAAVPSMLALHAHIRWREEGWSVGRLAAPIGLSLGLLGGEAALGAVAYLVAYEVAGAPGPRRGRLVSLIPAGIVCAAWAIGYRVLGHGVQGSGVYFDPGHAPLSWSVHAPGRALALVGQLVWGVSADLWFLAAGLRPAMVALGALGVVACVWLVSRADSSPGERRALGWLSLGAALSLLPVVSAFPSGRLCLFPAIGFAAVLGVLTRHAWKVRGSERQPRGFSRLVPGVVLSMAWFGGPIGWWTTAAVLRSMAQDAVALALSVELHPQDEVIVVNAPDPGVAYFLPVIRAELGRSAPAAWEVLSMSPRAHMVVRPSASRIVVRAEGGLLRTEWEKILFRDPKRVGDRVVRDGRSIEVLETDADGVAAIAVDSPRLEQLKLVGWNGEALVDVPLPEIGGTTWVRP